MRPVKKRVAYTRGERELQILTAFTVQLQAGHDGKMTVADIARKLGITPSTKLRIIINDLVVGGLLEAEREYLTVGGVCQFRVWYSLPYGSGYEKSPKTAERRQIKMSTHRRGHKFETFLFSESEL